MLIFTNSSPNLVYFHKKLTSFNLQHPQYFKFPHLPLVLNNHVNYFNFLIPKFPQHLYCINVPMDIKCLLHMDFHANLNLIFFHLPDPKNVFQQKSFPQIPLSEATYQNFKFIVHVCYIIIFIFHLYSFCFATRPFELACLLIICDYRSFQTNLTPRCRIIYWFLFF